MKRRSFSRAHSLASNNRLTSSSTNDDIINNEISATTSLTLMNDRARSLSTEHRLANQSQMSIASRTSIRYSTPRESTVFTKTDAPPVIRLLQQVQSSDTTDAIKTIIEHQRTQQTSTHHEHIQTLMIMEEDTSSPSPSSSNANIKSPIRQKSNNGLTKSNVIVPAVDNMNKKNCQIDLISSTTTQSNHTVLSTVKRSLLKHQQQKSTMDNSIIPENTKQNHQHTSEKTRVCCIII